MQHAVAFCALQIRKLVETYAQNEDEVERIEEQDTMK